MSKEYVLKRLESLGLIDNQQITQAFISMYTSSSKMDGFPICELILKGISSRYEADLVALTVSLNGEKVKSVSIPVIKDDFNKYRVTIDPSVVEKLTKKTAECYVVAVDKYGRELVSVSSIIKFDILNEIPSIDSTISFVDSIRVSGDDIRSDVAEITLLTDLSTSVCVELSNSDEVLWQNNIHLISGTPVNHVVSVNSSVIDDSMELRIVIRNDGGVIAEKSKFITVERDIVDPPKQKEVLNVIGDLILPDFIDTHTVVEDYVSVGELALLNKGEDSDIIVSVIFDGTDLLCFRMHMMAGDRSIGLSAPFTRLAREETYACEMIAHVTDVLGNTLIHKVCTLMVRSKYDMNLRELRLRSAQFVNPRNKLVSEMVENSNSLLATSMSGRYMVQGYQNGGSDIIRQMEAVYVMMNQMGMRYVSDTFSFNRSSENYQHVRAPDRVMLDKSGNCVFFMHHSWKLWGLSL